MTRPIDEKTLGGQNVITRLSHLRETLLGKGNLEEKLKQVTNAVVKIFDADFSRIWLTGPGDLCDRGCSHAGHGKGPAVCRQRNRCLHLMASSGRYVHIDGTYRRVPLGHGKIGALATGQAAKLVTNHVSTDPRIHDHTWSTNLNLVSFAGYRLLSDANEPIGVFSLFSKHPISIETDMILEGLANSISQVIQAKQAEERLRESEESLRLLFETINDGIFVHRFEADGSPGHFVEVNTVGQERLGYTRDEFLKLKPVDIADPEHWEGLKVFRKRLRDSGKVLFETVHVAKDGTRIPVESNVCLFTYQGKQAALSISRDIRDRRQAEDERRRLARDYQTLFREMLDGFALHEIICDREGKPVDYRFLAANPAFERMTGLKGQAIVGKTVLDVLPGTESTWIETFGRVALTGTPALFENYSKELDKYFEVTAFQPAPNQFACIFSDITGRKRAEAELGRSHADLAAKNEELEQMVYVASHDLRSPLVNIDGYGRELDYAIKALRHTLAGEPAMARTLQALAPLLEEDIPEALRFIRTSAARMDTLLTGLLRLSRSGREALSIGHLDMNRLMTTVIDSFEFQIKKDGIDLHVDDLPPCQGDPVQVSQVFANLLGNGLKYLDPERPGVIRVTGRAEGERSVYCVGDNGIGIESSHMEKIFEIFHRLDPAHGEGEGLGLTIVKRIMGRLAGDVRVESEHGAGSRFFCGIACLEFESLILKVTRRFLNA